jgi:Spy/CpxP family protein refolding chaperone
MKRHANALWVGSLAVLLIAGGIVLAHGQNPRRLQQGPGAGPAMQGMFRARMFLAGLDLTDQQKEQVKTIFADHKDEIKSVVQDTVQARKGLRAAIAANSGQDALKAAYGEVSDAGWNALQLRTKIGAEIKQILTPDQQAKLQKRLQNMNRFGFQLRAKRLAKKEAE